MNNSSLKPFPVGTIVKLKSGGPAMTVNAEPSENGKQECFWFVPPAEVRGADFHVEALVEKSVIEGVKLDFPN